MSTTNEAPAAFRHAANRPGPIHAIREAIGDISSRQRLVRYLVAADIRKKGANTLLGNLWWIMDPLLQMGVYVVFVSLILNVDTPDYPLFILAAILPWKWFTSSISDAVTSVVSQERLIKQIQFPKLVLPVASTMAGVVGFVFGLIPLAAIMLLYSGRISAFLLLIPVIAVVQFVFTLGLSILVSAVNVFFRDLGNVLRHVLRLWFYLSPALYGMAQLDASNTFQANPWLRFAAHANPFAVLFESYRSVIYGTPEGLPHAPDWIALLVLFGASVLLLAVATFIFKRLEPLYATVL
ncbi:MAG: ABC transporter permease [Chloroflexi bacterium]|nr:ABC transporter permease [Chloroflexota bacterium]